MFFQRVRYNDDAYYILFHNDDYEGHQVELTAGCSLLRFVRGLELGGELSISRELNRYYVVHNDVTNLNLQLRARFRP